MLFSVTALRFAAHLMIAVFSLTALDVPLPLASAKLNPKTCCGRIVCQCKHAKGAACPIRQAAAQKKSSEAVQKKPAPKACHLMKHAVEKTEAEKNTVSEIQPRTVQDSRLSFFKKAPCHSEKAAASSAVYAKEYFFSRLLIDFSHPETPFAAAPVREALLFPGLGGIERPPRLF